MPSQRNGSNSRHSKLDYLSKKYAGGGGGGGNLSDDEPLKVKKQKKQQKKQKKEKKKKQQQQQSIGGHHHRIVGRRDIDVDDDDDGEFVPSRHSRPMIAVYDSNSDTEGKNRQDSTSSPVEIGGDDEGPIVVNSMGEIVDHSDDATKKAFTTIREARGVWETEGQVSVGPEANTRKEVPNNDHEVFSSEQQQTSADTSSRHRRRYDSSDDESTYSTSKAMERGQRRRFDSDDEPSPKKVDKRENDHNASDSSSSLKRQSRKRRYDSDDNASSDSGKSNSPDRRSRRRYDSSSSSSSEDDNDGDDKEEVEKTKKHSGDLKKARMSSGHKAGLQNYQDFNEQEAKIQAQKKKDAQLMVDKYGMGETVYRNSNSNNESGTSKTPKRKELDVHAQAELNVGKVQKEARIQQEKEFQHLQESSFARYKDDDRLEEQYKSIIHKDDPMAAYAYKKQQQEKAKARRKKAKKTKDGTATSSTEVLEEEKPLYKGPPPKPNRYGIRPGYRWDGVDRGNGFEDKLLAKQYSANRQKEDAYRWRSADM